jgi:hypothetical protein
MSDKITPSIIEYTYKQGDIVAYSLTTPEGNLEGTGRIVGVATNPLPIMGSIYMVFDPENFPNKIYQYTTIPMQESALELIGHTDEEYLLISNWPDSREETRIYNFGNDYKKAKVWFNENTFESSSSQHLVSVIKRG